MEHTKIDNCIEVFNDYKEIKQQQRMRGLNDFNIFTTILNKSDEVRLHSRFLRFLLDPNAEHYQGDLFLRLFLQECNIELDFFSNLDDCVVYCEYKKIDIYITDGTKHIIIENKIWAGDQQKQISRYIEEIKKENKGLDNDNLIVMYLSLDRREPSKYSLNNFEVKNGCLYYEKEQEYKFYNINYNKQIKKWLEKSHKQVANITNLSVGIIQYMEVIAKLYGTYKEKVMGLNEYLKGKNDRQKLVKTMGEISEAYKIFRKKEIDDFFDKSVTKLKQEKEFAGWEVIDDDKLKAAPKWQLLLRIRQSETSKVLFGFEFNESNFIAPYFSVVRNNEVDFKELKENSTIKELLEKSELITKPTTWYLVTNSYYKKDILDKIIDDGSIEKAVANFVSAFIKLFKDYKEVVIKCNEILEADNK